MNRIANCCLVTSLVALCAACAGENAQNLAAKLDSALKSGDMDAALALLDGRGLPGEVKFFYMDLVPDCFEHLTCTVTAGPVTDEYKKEMAEQKQSQGLEVAPEPEGILLIKQEGEKEHGKMELPFAKVDGKYKVIAARYSAQKLGALKAQTGQTLADEALATGMQTMAGDLNSEWKTNAKALAAGGGDAGAAFVASTNAMAKAAKANDVNAMIAAGGEWAAVVFRDKDFDGKPVSLHRRELKMRAQAVRQLADVEVLGGYQQGDVAIITFQGHDGAGWVVRGFKVMENKDNRWDGIGGNQVSVPPT